MRFGTGSFNGLSFGPGEAFEVSAVQGWWDQPTVRTADVAFPLDHGESTAEDFLGARTVTLDFVIRGVDPGDLQVKADQLAAVTVPQATPTKLIGQDDAIYVLAKPRRRRIPFDSSGLRKTAVATVEFYCADPRRYQDRPIDVARSSGGSDFYLSATAATAGNVGNFTSPMAWWVKNDPAAVSSITRARLTMDGAVILDWNGAIAAGETMVFSFRNRTALRNNDPVNGNAYGGITVFAATKGMPAGGASVSHTLDGGTGTSFLRYTDAWV